MDDFETMQDGSIKCIHCNKQIKSGIVSISKHWIECLHRKEGLIISENDLQKQVLDNISINK